MFDNEDIKPDELQRLADIHIKRFEEHLKRYGHELPGHETVNARECRRYLKTWESIKKKNDWKQLDDTERMEVMDALESGE